MKALWFVTIVSASVLAAPPAEKRIAALMLPMDRDTEGLTLKLEAFANQALNAFDGFAVRSSDELFGLPADEDAVASLKRAEQGFTESRAAFDERNYEDAERKLRATIKEYGTAAPAMKTCGNLCEAVAMYGAALQARGDTEEAKLAILDLLALAPTLELDRKRYPQGFLQLKAQVATSRNAQLRGNATIKTKPAGARVYLDGEFQGFTPFTLQTLPLGKHLVRVERPGFRKFGALVEITPEDQEVAHELVASTGYAAFDKLMDRLAGEALKDKGGQAMSSVGASLKLERAVIGVLRDAEGGSGTELTMGYFDLKSGRRLAIKRASFQGDEFGQLKGEVERMVNHLINSGEGGAEQVTRSSDPLENRTGAEDWNSEDRGGRNTSRDKKKKGGDPLEGHSGTEDW